uniref:Uncharacterized protein n=1 Tax=Arundo donax TaxID=35708 RepID=A0A0A9D4B3_ARUDO
MNCTLLQICRKITKEQLISLICRLHEDEKIEHRIMVQSQT